MKCLILSLIIIYASVSIGIGQENKVIPLNIKHSRAMIPVKLGDLTIPDILLDSGYPVDGMMIYNPDYRDSVHYPNAMDVLVPGAGGGKPSTALLVDSIEFVVGNQKMINQRLLILQSNTFKGFHSNGIIGFSIFGHYLTEFNYDNQTMILHDSAGLEIDNSWTALPIYFKNNKIPWIDVSVVIDQEDPIPVSTYIDFAAGDVIELLERDEMKFSLPEETEDAYLGRGLSGDIYGKHGQISKLIIGPYVLNDVKATIAPAKIRSKQKNADAIIGSGP